MARFLISGLGCVALASCAVAPKATMDIASSYGDVQSAKQLVAVYYLQGSRLTISSKKTGDGATTSFTLTVTNEPVEDTSQRFILRGHKDLLSRTTLSATKRPNTDLVDTVGSEVTDNRTNLISNAGAILKAGIQMSTPVSGSQPQQEFTVQWSLTEPGDFKSVNSARSGWMAFRHKQIDDLTIAVGPPPVTATPGSKVTFGKARSGIFASACRPVLVSYSSQAGEQEWRGKIADATALEYIPLPAKGKIEFHSQCGASSSHEKDPTSTLDAVVAAAAVQAAAVSEAFRRSKE